MRRGWLLALLILILWFGVRNADACTCIQPGPACQAFWKTDAVFDATVESIESVAGPEEQLGERRVASREKLVRMSVRQALKGVTATGPLDVFTAEHGAACGYDFKVGRRYLVFAWKRPLDGRWVASLCSATQEFNGTGDTAAFLASLAEPPRGARVFGRINAVYDPLEPDERPPARIDATLRLSGGEERTVKSTGGSFEFTGLAAGAYRLELEMPQGYATYSASRFIDLPNARACVEEQFGLTHAGRITGVVRDAGGRTPKVSIEVARADAKPHPELGLRTRSTMALNDGAFEIAGLAPGTYILGVNLADLPSRHNPYSRTVYPSDGSADALITIGVGHTQDVGTWRLPPPLPVSKVSGVAVWEDGSPAAGVQIGVRDVTGHPVDRARGAGSTKVAADGSFELELRQGRTYTFVARDASNEPLTTNGPRLQTSAGPQTIRLVIRRAP